MLYPQNYVQRVVKTCGCLKFPVWPADKVLMKFILIALCLFHSLAFPFSEKWTFKETGLCEKFKTDFVAQMAAVGGYKKLLDTDGKEKVALLALSNANKKKGIAFKKAIKGNCLNRSEPCQKVLNDISKEYLNISKAYLNMYSVLAKMEEVTLEEKIYRATSSEDNNKKGRSLKLLTKGTYWRDKAQVYNYNLLVLYAQANSFCKATEEISL